MPPSDPPFDREKAGKICAKLPKVGTDLISQSSAVMVVAARMLPAALAEIDRLQAEVEARTATIGRVAWEKDRIIEAQAARIEEQRNQIKELAEKSQYLGERWVGQAAQIQDLRSREQKVEASLAAARKALVEAKAECSYLTAWKRPETPTWKEQGSESTKELHRAEALAQLRAELPDLGWEEL